VIQGEVRWSWFPSSSDLIDGSSGKIFSLNPESKETEETPPKSETSERNDCFVK
jgi:hypothetical protein